MCEERGVSECSGKESRDLVVTARKDVSG